MKPNQINKHNTPKCLHVCGGNVINGTINIAGAKNAVLPIMAAKILTKDDVMIKNLPHLDDVALMNQVLGGIGIVPNIHSIDTIELQGSISSTAVPIAQTQQMRASILVLGPLLARYGEVTMPYPGGCIIGPRPIDLHLNGLKQLGAQIEENDGAIYAKAPKGLHGAHIVLPYPTVGGTENILMAATLASGETRIENAAIEPEISDLIKCLQKMGAQIKGMDSNQLTIQGVKQLHGCSYRVMSDRIEAGTYLAAAAVTKGRIKLNGIDVNLIQNILTAFKQTGAEIECQENSVSLDMQGRRPLAVDINTGPYPQFPTDMQAQFTALNTVALGQSQVRDSVFKGRTSHLKEMIKMQADIRWDNSVAHINGKEMLEGAVVEAQDLRASASLVIAGLVANNKTTILKIEHIDRGYQWLEEQLRSLGADVKRELYFG